MLLMLTVAIKVSNFVNKTYISYMFKVYFLHRVTIPNYMSLFLSIKN